jgi:hypothetical protein
MMDIHNVMELLYRMISHSCVSYTVEDGYVSITLKSTDYVKVGDDIIENPIVTTKKFSEMQLISIYMSSSGKVDFLNNFLRKWEKQPSEVMNNVAKI